MLKYYVFRHYPSSCFYLKRRPVSLSKHNVSETGFCLRLQVRPTQLGPVDRATNVPASQTSRSYSPMLNSLKN
jgi:hypothetical protein